MIPFNIVWMLYMIMDFLIGHKKDTSNEYNLCETS